MTPRSLTARGRGVRYIAAGVVVAVILGAFALKVYRGETIRPWLVLVVSVLALAAGTALFGREAIETAKRATERER